MICRPRDNVRTRIPLLRSEEHTSELQSRVDISYAVFCLKKKEYVENILAPSWDGLTTAHVALHAPRAVLGRAEGVLLVRTTVGGRTPPLVYFFNDTATTEIYTLSLHDALPI